jgi:hypothetical protein
MLFPLCTGEIKATAASVIALLARGSEERKMAIQYQVSSLVSHPLAIPIHSQLKFSLCQGALSVFTNMLGGEGRAEAAMALASLIHGSESR